MAVIAPYGSWASPITAELLVEKTVQLSGVQVDGDVVYWVEGRPAEGGRQALVRRLPDGSTEDVLPPDGNARTLVHEYGGRSYAVRDGVVVFASFADQRLWRLDPGASEPVALSPEPPTPRGVRFGDLELTPDGRFVVAVRERHLGSSATEVVNDVVAVPIGGGEPVVLAEGHDFYAAPRVAPAGDRICWLSWDHPNMPWDGTELFTAPFSDGALRGEPARLAGGREESVSRPRWSPEGRPALRLRPQRVVEPVPPRRRPAAAPRGRGVQRPRLVARGSRATPSCPTGASSPPTSRAAAPGWPCWTGRDSSLSTVAWTSLRQRAAVRRRASSRSRPRRPTRTRSCGSRCPAGTSKCCGASRTLPVDPSWISVAEPITFATEDGLEAHALLVPAGQPRPRRACGGAPAPDRDVARRPDRRHRRPRSTSSCSTGPAAASRSSTSTTAAAAATAAPTASGCEDRWGIVDVDDCVNAARWLAEQGEVDGDRMVIRGGSRGRAGPTLAALTFRDVFAAGASYFGVADAEALALDTHKFESRYLDGLIGPYPQARDVYRERSPIHHTDQLSTPMILFQGLEDMVVPAAQSEMMAEALRAKGIPFAYLAYEGEQHGFRKAETIIRCRAGRARVLRPRPGLHPRGRPAPDPAGERRCPRLSGAPPSTTSSASPSATSARAPPTWSACSRSSATPRWTRWWTPPCPRTSGWTAAWPSRTPARRPTSWPSCAAWPAATSRWSA